MWSQFLKQTLEVMEKVWSEDNREKTKEPRQQILIADSRMDRLEGKIFDLIESNIEIRLNNIYGYLIWQKNYK